VSLTPPPWRAAPEGLVWRRTAPSAAAVSDGPSGLVDTPVPRAPGAVGAEGRGDAPWRGAAPRRPAPTSHRCRGRPWRHGPLLGLQAGVGAPVHVRGVAQGGQPRVARGRPPELASSPHLPPCALGAACPHPLAGRDAGADEGGASALALAGARRSRGTSSSPVRGRGRCPTPPLAWLHEPRSSPRRCDRLPVPTGARVGGGRQALLPPGGHLHPGGVGLRPSRLHPGGRVERDLSYSACRPSRRAPRRRWYFRSAHRTNILSTCWNVG
jgi:hypothetical protein